MVIIDRSVKFHSQEDEALLANRRINGHQPKDLADRWKQFLDQKPSEPIVQKFLENHPTLLPGLWDLHNGPLHDIVVTKLPLASNYETDFAFITRHSMALQFTFVEIEAPSKRIFNRDGSLSQEFQHARQQVLDWVLWAEKNIPLLLDMFSSMFATYNVTGDRKIVRGYLVYGRREEIEQSRQTQDGWQTVDVADPRIIVMSYDRLYAPESDRDLMVCSYETRGFYLKSDRITQG